MAAQADKNPKASAGKATDQDFADVLSLADRGSALAHDLEAMVLQNRDAKPRHQDPDAKAARLEQDIGAIERRTTQFNKAAAHLARMIKTDDQRLVEEAAARQRAEAESARLRSHFGDEQDARVAAEQLLAAERRVNEKKLETAARQRAVAEQQARELAATMRGMRRRRYLRLALWVMILVVLAAWIMRPTPAVNRYAAVSVNYAPVAHQSVVTLRPDPNGHPYPRAVRPYFYETVGATNVSVRRWLWEGRDLRVEYTVPPRYNISEETVIIHLEQESGKSE